MGFTFNSQSSDAKGLIVKAVNKPIMPPIITSTKQIGNTAYIGNRKFAPRVITIQVGYLASSTSDYNTKFADLATWLVTASAANLILSDDPAHYYKAVLTDDTAISQAIMYGETTLKFTCLDNAIYNLDNSKFWNPDAYL